MNLFIKAIILGIVEGITEFLPISSTGHLIIVNRFIEFEGNFAKVFDIVIQLGAILSVVVYFWDRIWPFNRRKSALHNREVWELWKKTIIAVIPALVFGYLFDDIIEEYLFNPFVVAIALIIYGILLILIENRSRSSAGISSIKDMSYKTAFLIGMIQCLAMVPGTSRSAATIIGAMLLGLTRSAAAEFSFFLAIPTMVAASGYTLLKSGFQLASQEWAALAIGFVISFLVALVVVSAFMGYIRKKDFKPFAYYRILLGVLVLILFGLVFR